MKPPYIPFPSFTPVAHARARSWSGPVRAAATAALCVLCYQAGRWTRGLEIPVEAPAVATPVASKTALRDFSNLSAAGQPVEDPVPQITPLEDRDPSALIMGPGSLDAADRASAAPDPAGAPVDDETPIRHVLRPKPASN